jgi:hypothetical protein
MKLNDMSVEDLRDFVSKIGRLCALGEVLENGQIKVRFDLTPGQPARLLIPELAMVPGFDGLDEMRSALADRADEIYELHSIYAAEDTEGEERAELLSGELEAENAALIGIEEPEDRPEPVTYTGDGDGDLVILPQAFSTREDFAAFAGVTAADPAPAAAREQIAHFDAPGQPDPEQPQPGSASALAQKAAFAKFWTDERDTILINAMAAGRLQNRTWWSVAEEFAATLGATPKAIDLRARQVLRPRIDARIAELRAAQPEPPAAEQTEQAASGPMATPAVEVALPPAAAPTATSTVPPADDLGKYLWTMSRKGGWDMKADHGLMELACTGWTMGDIAVEMGRDSKEIKERFELLTCLRRFKREDVLARLAAFVSLATAGK